MQKKINKILWTSILLLCIGGTVFSFFSSNVVTVEKRLYYMDTYIYVKLEGKNKEKLEEAVGEIDHIYHQYHELTNRYSGYPGKKNLYYIQTNEEEEDFLTLDPRLYDILEYAKRWYEESNHILDVTIGSAVDIWKEASEQNILPEEEVLSHLEKKELLLEDGKIYNNHVALDLGAIAKGYASLKVKEYLQEEKIDTYLINAGGMVLLGKAKQPYKVGLEDPTKEDGSIFMKIKAKDISIATSGGLHRYYEIDGKKYSHILNPATNFPFSYYQSVIVMTKDPLLADTLSTMLYGMELEEALSYVNQRDGVEAIFYVNEEEQILSEGVSQYLYE